jgi:thiamine kinase-like enzyme
VDLASLVERCVEIYDLHPIRSFDRINIRKDSIRLHLNCGETSYFLAINAPFFSFKEKVELRARVIKQIGDAIACPRLYEVKRDAAMGGETARIGFPYWMHENQAIELYEWKPSEAYNNSLEAFDSTVAFAARICREMDGIAVPSEFQRERYVRVLKRTLINDLLDIQVDFQLLKGNSIIERYLDSDFLDYLQRELAVRRQEVRDREPLLQALPLSTVHGDLHPGNIGYAGNRAMMVYDFEFVRHGFRIEDIARMYFELCSCAHTEEEWARLSDRFWTAFEKSYVLETDHKLLLGSIGAIRLIKEIGNKLQMIKLYHHDQFYESFPLDLRRYIRAARFINMPSVLGRIIGG